MGHNNQTNNCTDFFYHFFRNILLVSIPLVIISVVILSSLHISATGSGSSTDTLSFNISSSCTLSSVVDESHNAELINGTYVDGIGQTTITTLCNDGDGYSIYANGYSNNEEGNNKLVNTENSNFNIISGTAQSGTTSSWAMSLNNLVDDPSLTPPTIENTYNNTYGIVPNEWTKVASLPARATDMIKGSSFTTTYAVYTSSSQYAGTYNGQVKYMLVHPSYKPAVYFMQDVASWKDQLALEESVQAVDKRDGKSYWVTKLKDGNIWMTSNLDLDIGGPNTAPLSSNNTDISTDPNVYASSGIYSDYNVSDGVYTWNPVSTAITSSYYIDNASVKPSAWPQNNYTTPYSAEGGDTYYYTSNTTSADTRYSSIQACKNDHTEAECKRYFAGNYYNWSAAIASNNTANIGSVTGEIATNSICPKGWRLPSTSQSDSVNNEFGRMLFYSGITAALSNGNNSVGYKDSVTSFNKLRSDPYYFVRSGRLGGVGVYYTGVYGAYWSSTVNSGTNAYFLNFTNTDISPASLYNRYGGWSIRCLAR